MPHPVKKVDMPKTALFRVARLIFLPLEKIAGRRGQRKFATTAEEEQLPRNQMPEIDRFDRFQFDRGHDLVEQLE